MNLTHIIAQHILEVYQGGNWTEVNVKETLQNVTYEEAIEITPASPNSIAALMHHLSFYNEVVLQRLNGVEPVIDEMNGFDVPFIFNETGWQHLKERCFETAGNLAEAVRQLPEEKLEKLTPGGYSTYYKTLHGIAEHVHYHLGQMLLIKKLVKQKAFTKTSL
jgi:uncharacterized damage-inducible protein DinB